MDREYTEMCVGSSILDRVVMGNLSVEFAFEQRFKREGTSHMNIWGKWTSKCKGGTAREMPLK